MVLRPQGADQPINAARAATAGVAIVVGSAAELTDAMTRALHARTLHARTAEVAADIEDAPVAPADIIAILDDHVREPGQGVTGPHKP